MADTENYEPTFGPSLANLKNTLSAYLGDRDESVGGTKYDVLRNADDSKEDEEEVEARRLNVAIIGDSMLCGLNEKGMSRDNDVYLRNHGPCTSEDIAFRHIDAIVRRKPEVLIIHVGTHDITSEVDTRPNISHIVRQVQRKSPNTKIAISSVIGRHDRPTIEKDVARINYDLFTLCAEYSLDYISHESIDDDCLGTKRLHLNKKGNSCLATSFMRYLNRLA